MEAPIGFMVGRNPILFKSKISNCSQEGIFFESELNLLPGTVVFLSSYGESTTPPQAAGYKIGVQPIHSPQAAGNTTLRDSKYYRAEVKWTEKLDRAGVELYGIGAEYIDPP